jgi:hypothetical protein
MRPEDQKLLDEARDRLARKRHTERKYRRDATNDGCMEVSRNWLWLTCPMDLDGWNVSVVKHEAYHLDSDAIIRVPCQLVVDILEPIEHHQQMLDGLAAMIEQSARMQAEEDRLGPGWRASILDPPITAMRLYIPGDYDEAEAAKIKGLKVAWTYSEDFSPTQRDDKPPAIKPNCKCQLVPEIHDYAMEMMADKYGVNTFEHSADVLEVYRLYDDVGCHGREVLGWIMRHNSPAGYKWHWRLDDGGYSLNLFAATSAEAIRRLCDESGIVPCSKHAKS